MGVDDNASGVSIALEPPRPGAVWSRTFDGSLSFAPLVATAAGSVPAIDRVNGLVDGTAIVSGPIAPRLGIVAAASWRRLAHVAAPDPSELIDHAASAFAHLVFAATPRDEVRALGWLQRTKTAARVDTGLHLQATWERRDPANYSWRLFGGYTGRDRTETGTSTLVIDSLDTDPVSDLVDTGAGASRRWVAGSRIAAPATACCRHSASISNPPKYGSIQRPITQISELVNGGPARVWTYHVSSRPDVRQLTTLAAFANEHVTSGRLTLDAGLRFDAVSGDANDAVNGISWKTLLPRGLLRVQIFNKDDFAAYAGYRRTAYQMPLNVLAIGDPGAPYADVSRPTATSDWSADRPRRTGHWRRRVIYADRSEHRAADHRRARVRAACTTEKRAGARTGPCRQARDLAARLHRHRRAGPPRIRRWQSRPELRSRQPGRRPARYRAQPPGRRLRTRSLSADEPQRRAGDVVGMEATVRATDREAPAPGRSGAHRGERSGRSGRLPADGKRSGCDRQHAGRSERADPGPRPAVSGSIAHRQDRRRLSLPSPHHGRRDLPLRGRPAVHASW